MNGSIRGKNILIVGYGREGRATHRYLLAHYPELSIAIADQQTINLIPEAAADTLCFQGDAYLKAMYEFDTIIRSPGVPFSKSVRSDLSSLKILVSSATNIFFEECKSKHHGKIIGVTGTKGKSTTSSLIAHIIAAHFPDVRLAGNIGKPMLDQLAGSTSQTIFVLELSSFQLEDLNAASDIAVLLNIVPEHLNHHGSFEEYREAKVNLVRHLNENSTLICNDGFAEIAQIAQRFPKPRKKFFSVGEDNDIFPMENKILIQGSDLTRDKIPLRGPGNIQNVSAAITCARTLDVPNETIVQQIKNFRALPYRLDPIGTYHGITFINDSLSTVPEALINALAAFQDSVETVIAGGYDRGLDFSVLKNPLLDSNVKHLLLFPTTGAAIWEALGSHAKKKGIQYIHVDSMEQAVREAYRLTTPGHSCLLSPASSSFNLFKDYQDRGDQFKYWVEKLSAH